MHIYPDPGQQVDSSAPLWIIVVSVLAGVLLLALICLLLWKVNWAVTCTEEVYQQISQPGELRTSVSSLVVVLGSTTDQSPQNHDFHVLLSHHHKIIHL